MQETVRADELQERLHEYLRRAQQGERVVITENGRPVAVLAALEPAPELSTAWALVQRGVASWKGGKPRGAQHPPHRPGSAASQAVLDARR